MPAQVEEAVLGADRALEAEHLGPQAGQDLGHRIEAAGALAGLGAG
jgi:hypothetical protein